MNHKHGGTLAVNPEARLPERESTAAHGIHPVGVGAPTAEWPRPGFAARLRALVASMAMVLGLAPSPAVAVDTLLSLHKPVTGSSYFASEYGEIFPFHNVTDGFLNDIYDAESSNNHWSFWITPDRTNGWVQVDLGEAYRITRIEVQDTRNRGYFDRGTAEFRIGTSVDGSSFTTAVQDAFSIGDRNSLAIRGFDLSGVQARYVRFEALSRYGNSAGLNEMMVYGLPVPEPHEYLLLAAGLGMVASMARRRRGEFERQ